MSTKSTEERVSALESWAFQTGRDLAEIKAVQAEHTNRLAAMDERLTGMDERMTGMDERMVRLEYGVGLLLDHYGIQRPQP
ncbi:hypothetical protein [Nonomuraea ferruginea]|uniref:Uncharacterized protein n=1 Tax=Nonomuraea ferruginea TaxID=46174 RepID=A0ABT4T1G9_9ACTN|nr:hypothetical protein [Nonomuraea ferruginea]MDA0643358.1 hypothetical protein [Nonomuraea ferruginea]